jgi:hypothetical protein
MEILRDEYVLYYESDVRCCCIVYVGERFHRQQLVRRRRCGSIKF